MASYDQDKFAKKKHSQGSFNKHEKGMVWQQYPFYLKAV